jgi:hypothetical protein
VLLGEGDEIGQVVTLALAVYEAGANHDSANAGRLEHRRLRAAEVGKAALDDRVLSAMAKVPRHCWVVGRCEKPRPQLHRVALSLP